MGKNSGSRKRDASDEDSEISDETIKISDREPPKKHLRTLRFTEQRPSQTGGNFMRRPRSPLGLFGRRWGEAPPREYSGTLFGRGPDEPPPEYYHGLFGRPSKKHISPLSKPREQSPIRMGYLSGRGRESNQSSRYSMASEDIGYAKEELFRKYIEDKVEEKVNRQLAMILRDEKRTN